MCSTLTKVPSSCRTRSSKRVIRKVWAASNSVIRASRAYLFPRSPPVAPAIAMDVMSNKGKPRLNTETSLGGMT
eukprot:scaffold3946_cov177-Amphora_coffeaeformis.AAC.9